MISSGGLGNVRVPYSPEWNPNAGGGPIQRAGNFPFYQPRGYDVFRTSSENVVEGEPGANWEGRPYHFNQNGVVFDGGTFGGALGATENRVFSVGPTVTMALGAGAGVMFANPNHKIAGALIGALAGGILGIIFAPG